MCWQSAAATSFSGKYYKTDKKTIEGLGILDITTEWKPERLIRNIVLNSPLFEQPVVGFENHGGRTYIGDHTPFGKVFYGLGKYREIRLRRRGI